VSKARDDAQDTAVLLAIGGVLLGGLGTALALFQWPRDDGSDHNTAVWLIGVALGGLGQLMVLVAVIAWGVRLGIGWSGLLDPARSATAPPATAPPPSYLDEDGR